MWIIHRARKKESWSPALMLFAVLAFAMLHWRHGLQSGMSFADYVIMPTARVDLRATSPTIDTIEARLDAPARTVGFVDNFFPGWSGAYNLEGMCGAAY